ncbi:MAG: biopolymer transporter ExbD [Myxococcota bacterium]
MVAPLRKPGRRPMTDINVTPFVDILLVVLIAFLVTSTLVAEEQIPIDAPEAATGEDGTLSLAIVRTNGGQTYLDGALVDQVGIRKAIRAARATGREVACLVGADGDVPHREVMALVDLVRQEGVVRFGILVTPVPVPPDADRDLP